MTSPVDIWSLRASGAICIAALFAVLVTIAAWFAIASVRGAPAEAAVTVDLENAKVLSQMSTGEVRDAVATGDTAIERNARIPIERLASGRVKAFTDIPVGSAAFARAEECLTQAVYYEAANESLQGKRAVAQVVLNRVRHPAYPNSVCGVVYEGARQSVCQFSFTCDGSLLRAPAASKWNESAEVARRALQGEVESSVGTATHYHADYVLPRWAFTLGKIKQIDRHIFYRFRNSWGASGSFDRKWSGRETVPPIDRAWLLARLSHRNAAELERVEFVPGLTVAPDIRDRHAENDVGGRLDTTKEWRLTIPNPTTEGDYHTQLESHGVADPMTEPSDGGHTI